MKNIYLSYLKNFEHLSLLICLLLSTFTFSQNTINIPLDATNLSDAVQMAQAGDTIFLSAGTYTDSVHINNKNLVIKGELNGSSILSPGEKKSFVVLNSTVEFYNLTFNDFQLNTPPPNIGIDASYSEVKISKCHFINMNASILTLWTTLEINNSIMDNIRGKCILHHGGNFLIYNNLIHHPSYSPVSMTRANGQFFNNTLIGSTPNQYRGIVINPDSLSHIYNNIISNFGIGIQLIASDSSEFHAPHIYNNNIYNMAAPYWYEYNESLSLPIYSGALTPNPGTGEISSPALFADTLNGDYTLLPNSPGIDEGIDAYTFNLNYDLDGNNRVIGSSPDIGAYEFNPFLNTLEQVNTLHALYPNPTANLVVLQFTSPVKGKLQIYDATGKQIEELNVKNKEKIEVKLPHQKGLYILKLNSNKGTEIYRVIKQ